MVAHGRNRKMPAREFVTLTATVRTPEPGDQFAWIDYHAVSSKGIGGIDWAVIEFVDGVQHGGSRLYNSGPKTGDTYLDAPFGSTVTAFVVDLIGGGYSGQPPISNTVTVTV